MIPYVEVSKPVTFGYHAPNGSGRSHGETLHAIHQSAPKQRRNAPPGSAADCF